MTRIITITSGKGGVGKTNISVNAALQLAASGHKTCLFDADLGLANVNILLQLNPERNLEDALVDNCSLHDIIIRDYHGIDIIPGSSGIERMANLEPVQIDRLIQSFSQLDVYDIVLFDTSAGISRDVLAFCLASSEVVLVICPEPTSLTDAYSLLKVLTQNKFKGMVKVVMNQCSSVPRAKQAYNKFKETVQKYLHLDLTPLGIVVQDPRVVDAIKAQEPFILRYPQSNAAQCIRHIAENLLKHRPDNLEGQDLATFWSKCTQIITSPLIFGTTNKTKPGSKEDNAKALKDETQPNRLQEPPKDAMESIPAYLNQLVESISTVSSELQRIRRVLEDGKQHELPRSSSGEEKTKDTSSISIPLDFDAFLNQQDAQ
jgi:flagellar biosynthesis protein FlhG